MPALRFIFLVLPETHLLDLAGPDQVLSEAIDLGADFKMEYCGIEPDIQTSAGLGIHRLKHFSEVQVQPGDYLIVPGSRVKYILSAEFRAHTDLFQWLKTAHQTGAQLVSICVGAFVLAEAGLLNGLPCTTHFQLTQQLQARFPRTQVRENVLFVSAGNIHSSAGIASGIDLMLHILEQVTDSYFAHKVARELVAYNRRNGATEQVSAYFNFRNHIHQGIHKVQDYVVEHLAEKFRLDTLADLAGMSERNFTRIFKKETGITVNEFLTKIRIEKIKELSQSPDLSKAQIARQVGLGSVKQVDRLLKLLG